MICVVTLLGAILDMGHMTPVELRRPRPVEMRSACFATGMLRVLWTSPLVESSYRAPTVMLNSVSQQDRSASPARRNGLDADGLGQASIVQKRLRSPRPAKKRQGQGPPSERILDSAVATCSYGDDAAQGLSQLSDLVKLDASQDASLSQDYPAEVASHFPSQEGQDAGPSSDSQTMLEAPPSQPDIPLATLAVSRPQADPPQEQPPEIVHPFPHFALPVQQQMVPQRLAGMGSPVTQNLKEESQQPLHPKSRATRRGPMDEMRQLVR